MADQGREALVNGPLLPAAHLIHSSLHFIVDASFRGVTKDLEGMVVGIEQYLVGLRVIGAQEEGSAVAEPEVSELQLGIHAVTAA